MGKQVPIVDYLVLDDGAPHLIANRCDNCGALYFDRRNACAKCSGRSFSKHRLADDGTVRSFPSVPRAAPGAPPPSSSAAGARAGGGVVKANLLTVGPSPDDVRFGMTVRRATVVAGVDDEGTEAVQFGYEPV